MKREYNSFDECLDKDGYYNVRLVNWQTLNEDTVMIPKHIVIACDLSKNLMQIDDVNYHLVKVLNE